MSYGPVKAFTCVIASGASTSSSIDLGKSNTQLAVLVGTMSTGSPMSVFGSTSSSGTYSAVYYRVASSTAQYNLLSIATAASATWSVIDPIPFQYIQFVATSGVISGGCAISVLAQD